MVNTKEEHRETRRERKTTSCPHAELTGSIVVVVAEILLYDQPMTKKGIISFREFLNHEAGIVARGMSKQS